MVEGGEQGKHHYTRIVMGERGTITCVCLAGQTTPCGARMKGETLIGKRAMHFDGITSLSFSRATLHRS